MGLLFLKITLLTIFFYHILPFYSIVLIGMRPNTFQRTKLGPGHKDSAIHLKYACSVSNENERSTEIIMPRQERKSSCEFVVRAHVKAVTDVIYILVRSTGRAAESR